MLLSQSTEELSTIVFLDSNTWKIGALTVGMDELQKSDNLLKSIFVAISNSW